MEKEVADKILNNKKQNIIPTYKKVWYSITKFEKYPEMAAEGVGRAFIYLAFLIIIFAVVFTTGIVINLEKYIDKLIYYIDNEVSVMEYKDNNLNVKLKNGKDRIITDGITFIINTDSTTTKEKIVEKENKMILLKDHMIVSSKERGTEELYYKDLFNELGIESFSKSDIINLIEKNLKSTKAYLFYYIIILISVCIAFFISTLTSILLLSIFGMVTTLMAGIKMRYRAVFNMSIYSVTLSIILQLIYMTVNLFIDFRVKYFDFMYTAIAYICLSAAIFMIKLDVKRQHIEMIRIMKSQENKPEVEEKKDEETQGVDGKAEGEGV